MAARSSALATMRSNHLRRIAERSLAIMARQAGSAACAAAMARRVSAAPQSGTVPISCASAGLSTLIRARLSASTHCPSMRHRSRKSWASLRGGTEVRDWTTAAFMAVPPDLKLYCGQYPQLRRPHAPSRRRRPRFLPRLHGIRQNPALVEPGGLPDGRSHGPERAPHQLDQRPRLRAAGDARQEARDPPRARRELEADEPDGVG